MNLALALEAEPKLMVCNEITSALDTVVARAILKLLHDKLAGLSLAGTIVFQCA